MRIFIFVLSICSVSFATFSENGLDNAENLTYVQDRKVLSCTRLLRPNRVRGRYFPLAAFMKYGLDTKLPHLPPNKLLVHYDTDTKVHLGTELELQNILEAPTVIFEAEPDIYYTLIMIDVDSPTKEKPFFGELLIWKVVNIPGSKIHKGETVTEYSAHAPWQKGEAHRYVLLLYKQHQKQVFSDKFQSAFHTSQHRIGFSSLKYSMRYRLGRPIAGNFFQLKHTEGMGNQIFRHHHWTPHH